MIKLKQINRKYIKWAIRAVAIAIPFAGIWIGYNIIGWSFTNDCNLFIGMGSLMLGGSICVICGVGIGFGVRYVIDIFPRIINWIFED